MDESNVRAITNSFQDVRLVSLKDWRKAEEIEPRDQGGPYMVVQEGYDPLDAKARSDEFVLGRHGKWVCLGIYFRLPGEVRRREYVFGTAAEVISILESLPSDASTTAPGPIEELAHDETSDDLKDAFLSAKVNA